MKEIHETIKKLAWNEDYSMFTRKCIAEGLVMEGALYLKNVEYPFDTMGFRLYLVARLGQEAGAFAKKTGVIDDITIGTAYRIAIDVMLGQGKGMRFNCTERGIESLMEEGFLLFAKGGSLSAKGCLFFKMGESIHFAKVSALDSQVAVVTNLRTHASFNTTVAFIDNLL